MVKLTDLLNPIIRFIDRTIVIMTPPTLTRVGGVVVHVVCAFY